MFPARRVPLEVRMPLCIGTSLAIIIPTSIRSYRAHYARGAVDMDILRQMVAAGAGRRYRRQRDRALRAGAAVQDRVRDGGWSAAARLLLARETGSSATIFQKDR